MNTTTVNYFEELISMKSMGFNVGTTVAIRCYKESRKLKTEYFNAHILPDYDIHPHMQDFVETLKYAGIKTFTVTYECVSLINHLKALEDCGCKMVGTCNINYWCEYRYKELPAPAIKFIIE